MHQLLYKTVKLTHTLVCVAPLALVVWEGGVGVGVTGVGVGVAVVWGAEVGAAVVPGGEGDADEAAPDRYD